MDTRFWGPPAWRLLHTVAAHGRGPRREFFETLPYVLPCKFCRANLTAHYEALPYDNKDLEKYVYELHKRVSAGLRKEGGTPAPAPTFRDVQRQYAELPAQMPAWDFLFAVAYTYPPQTREAPMPDAPAHCPAGATDCERNRWNMLPAGRRMHYWMEFWKLLPGVLPAEWGERWETAVRRARPVFTAGRRAAIASLWRIRCAFEGNKADPYVEVCDRLVYHSSGCGTAAGKGPQRRTCRRLQERRLTRRKHSPSKD